MATAIQRRRGTTTQHGSFTGLAGEITIDTDKNTIVVHDGSTAGGYPLAKYSDVSALGGADITDVVAGAGLTGGATSGSATINVIGGNGITVTADEVTTDDTYVKALFSAGGDLTYSNGVFSFTNDAGDIESVTAGTGLTGGGTTGALTLNVIGGDGITAAADEITVDSTVVRTSGTQTVAGAKTFSDDAIFSGNLTVNGTQTTVNTATLSVADNMVVLNSDEAGTPSQDAGIEIERGTSTNVKLQFKESTDKWQFSNDGSTYVDLATDTDTLTEGSTNLYHTTARARAAISAGGDLAYNSTTGVISFTNDAGDIEGVTAGSGLTGGGTSGTVSLALDYSNIAGSLVPSANVTYDLGSLANQWRDIYVGPGSLYVNGTKVLEDNSGTIQFTADNNQNISILTTGSGDLELTSGGTIQLKSDIAITASKTISSTGGVKLASNINMDSNNINNLDNPVADQDAATKAYVDATAQTAEEVQDIVGAMFTANTESGITVAYDDSDGTVDFTVGTLNQNTTGSAAQLTTARNISGVAFDGTADIELNTSHVDEHASNKYYTDERVADKIGAILTGSGNISVTYDDTADTITIAETLTTTDIVEGDNEYFTQARARSSVSKGTDGAAAYNSSTGVITIPGTTAHLTEDTNLFYTTERVQDVAGGMAVGGDGLTSTYDDSAGTLTHAVDGTVARLNASATFASDVIVSGNFTVNGTTTTVNTATLAVADNVVVLNSGTTGTPSEDSGIEVERGDLTNVKLQWDESGNKWQFTNDGSTYQDILTLAQTRAGLSVTDAGGDGSLAYNSSTGVITYTGPSASETRAHISVTDSGGDGSLSYSAGVITYTGPSATEVRAHLSAGTGLDYASGVFSVEAGSIGATQLTASGVTANTYGSGTAVPSIAVDADGRITSASTTAVAISHLDTDDLAEGTNKFFSTAQVDAHLTGGTGITYSAGTISLTDTGLITGVVAGTGVTGGATSGTATLNVSGLTVSELAAGSLQLSSESFADNDTTLMTSAAIQDKIATQVEAYGYSTTVGDITAVVAGTGLTGGATSGSATLTVDSSYITGLFSGGTGITYSAGAISLTDTGYVTGVTAGTGLSGGGTDGTVSLAFDGNELATSTTNGDGDYFVVVDASGVSRKLTKASVSLSEFSNDSGWTSNVGDITGVTAGSYLTGGGSSGAVSLAVDATSANTASKVVARDGSGNFSAGTITATASQAQYADLAERYLADADLEPGTVVMFGGDAEIKACDTDGCHAVAGVISTDPAYLMNSETDGLPVALTGRVPTKVTGPVAKGDLMVSSGMSGHAKADNNAQAGRIIGKAIGSSEGGEAVIEVLVNLM